MTNTRPRIPVLEPFLQSFPGDMLRFELTENNIGLYRDLTVDSTCIFTSSKGLLLIF